jgi:eukaryotic-like serine/threonine-protein kinase
MIGKVFAGRYELLEKIAEGGMARVYRGRDQLLKRTVAVKVLKDQMSGDAAFIRRFEREAQSAAALSHPHIVSIYDVGVEDDTYYMVMEYVDGNNLKEYIREKGPLPFNEAIRITRQIGQALEQAHAAGVVHRDIKPQNILFSKNGNIKVTDFGIAIGGDGVTVTVGDEIIGSVQYISPEQARGGMAGKQSDLYSLGIVLYEMVTGQVPFSGESPVAVVMKHIQEQIVPPRHKVEGIPESLEEVILRAVEKDTAKRYSSAAELLEDLSQITETGTAKKKAIRNPKENSFEENDEDVILRPGSAYLSEKQDHVAPARGRRALKIILAIIIPLLILSALGYLLGSYLFLAEVAVPDVRDLSQSEAAQLIREAGLVPNTDIIYINDDDVAVGNVVKTEPPEERVVRKNRVVDIYVSKGPEFLVTPDLFSRTEMEAQVILTDLGLIMSPVYEYNEDVPEGQVFRQVPGESFRISRGEEVVVYISEGRGPFELANLEGFSEEGAIAYLEDNDLRPRVRYQFVPGSSGYVVEQIPRPGEEVLPGESVDLVVGQ